MRQVDSMGLIGIIFLLFAGFMIIGFVAAFFNRDHDERERASNIAVSQKVPSVFDAFRNDGDSKQ